MTLVVERAAQGPAIHVLAIGVGAYRHLPGGSDPVTHDTLGLRQLSGPPRSVVAFVDWVVGHMRHPNASLGTVELLVSPDSTYGEDGAAPTAVEPPSLANVSSAFERWYGRCDENPDNVAMLYFCGHGVERSSPVLLLEDFGASKLALLKNAFDVGDLYEAMARCGARSQYFFVDACREIPFQLLEMVKDDASTLLNRKLIGDSRQDAALVLGTSGGAKAYGRVDQVTRFTAALVRALDGLGGRPEGGGWAVTVASLHGAVTGLMKDAADGAPPQQPVLRGGTGATPLHLCSEPPLVPVAVACDPPAAVASATVALTRFLVAGSSVPQPNAGQTGWSFEVPADSYLFSITFPAGGYRPQEQPLVAWPPRLDTHVVVATQ
jgi:hypothetical protein